MKLLISEETINDVFKNEENLEKFIRQYPKYFEYMLRITRKNPKYELTYEEFVKNIYGKVSLL